MGTTKSLLDSHPDVRVVMLLDELERENVVDAFRCGAKGVFGRNEPLATLLKCICCVHQGQVWASSREFQFLVEALRQSMSTARMFAKNGVSLLSEREQEVVRCACEGLNNRDIARRLHLSEHTVKNHLFRIYGRLGISSRIEVMFSALAQKLLEQPQKSSHGLLSGPEKLQFYLKQAEYSPLAQLALARIYLEGRGTEKDVVTGYMWLTLAEAAARDILEGSRAMKQELAAEMKPEERKEAEARARNLHSKVREDLLTPAYSLAAPEEPKPHPDNGSAAYVLPSASHPSRGQLESMPEQRQRKRPLANLGGDGRPRHLQVISTPK